MNLHTILKTMKTFRTVYFQLPLPGVKWMCEFLGTGLVFLCHVSHSFIGSLKQQGKCNLVVEVDFTPHDSYPDLRPEKNCIPFIS